MPKKVTKLDFGQIKNSSSIRVSNKRDRNGFLQVASTGRATLGGRNVSAEMLNGHFRGMPPAAAGGQVMSGDDCGGTSCDCTGSSCTM